MVMEMPPRVKDIAKHKHFRTYKAYGMSISMIIYIGISRKENMKIIAEELDHALHICGGELWSRMINQMRIVIEHTLLHAEPIVERTPLKSL